MPQFDFGTFPSQIFWLIVCFTALYFLLARAVLPKVGAVLEDRQRKMDDDLERATELEIQAKEALNAYQAEIDTARDEAQSAIRKAAEETAAKAEESHQELAAKLAPRLSRGSQRRPVAHPRGGNPGRTPGDETPDRRRSRRRPG